MRRSPRRPPRRRIAVRWLGLAAVVLVGFLYYHPIRSYLSTRSELAARRAEVRALAARRHALQRRLAASTSLEALAVEARRLGYVRPGERLYIVRGIEAWVRARSRSGGR